MSNKPYRLAVSNQKGGVGKSTVALNIAGALGERGQNVLLVDLDPQGYLTSGVGLDDEYTTPSPNLNDALKAPGEHAVDDLVVAHEEFDVLPANIDMFSLEQELVSGMRGRERLSMLLEDVTGYDFLVVDCPPSLGLLTDNALLACENVLIPAEAEDTSIRAVELLFKQIDSLEDNFGASIQEEALVVSNVDYPLDGEQQGMLEWFDDTFSDRIPVFEIRSRAVIKRAFNAGHSIFGHDEECDQADELLRIADYFIEEQS
ncbi:Spo0A activation inhibitor (plasmid) [Haloarcula marismortui ATCC 43049]|uniref:ParA family protein n=1 Tax=Haloarcula marismortui (strain ATCC 43049 / DSM 3752 / JCM 8966 / VKM B-1809) TaxID=272569 RepID=Q5V7H6_HALMA|nr:ParA family protein [Haloarcula marismortui]AAV44443.1 Spo0A activation inhibitor [Haloarcula marismortui ATCC 43049]QCP89601.1 ParA family protein [Haloarcula marismortui ATCC 43049]